MFHGEKGDMEVTWLQWRYAKATVVKSLCLIAGEDGALVGDPGAADGLGDEGGDGASGASAGAEGRAEGQAPRGLARATRHGAEGCRQGAVSQAM